MQLFKNKSFLTRSYFLIFYLSDMAISSELQPRRGIISEKAIVFLELRAWSRHELHISYGNLWQVHINKRYKKV